MTRNYNLSIETCQRLDKLVDLIDAMNGVGNAFGEENWDKLLEMYQKLIEEEGGLVIKAILNNIMQQRDEKDIML